MSLSTLRAKFKSESGRPDLSNASVDSFINDGIRLLDYLTNFEKSYAKYYQEVTVNTKVVNFSSDCRLIEDIWLIDSTSGKTQLEKVPFNELAAYYEKSGITTGSPLYYAPNIIRAYPDSFSPSALPYSNYSNFIEVATAYQSLRGIYIGPPADKSYLMEVVGKFYSTRLDADATPAITDNWWTVNHDRLVLEAALYRLYEQYRNNEGMKTYLSNITAVVSSLDYDLAEEESKSVTRMEG